MQAALLEGIYHSQEASQTHGRFRGNLSSNWLRRRMIFSCSPGTVSFPRPKNPHLSKKSSAGNCQIQIVSVKFRLFPERTVVVGGD